MWTGEGEKWARKGVCAICEGIEEGSLLPVIGGQLAASDIWHGSDSTALVLAIPNGAGYLQYAQDTPVPKTGKTVRDWGHTIPDTQGPGTHLSLTQGQSGGDR